MYSVVIVDDESWSLESIVNLLDWKAFGYVILKTFTDSEEAFDFIQVAKPDLVFTDIRMPVLSGIQLMRKTHEADLKSTLFVVVSGYDEFKYAQEALCLGAYDYKLKPMDPMDLEVLLIRLRTDLDDIRISRDIVAYKQLLRPADNIFSVLADYGLMPSGEYWQVFMLLNCGDEEYLDISQSFLKINGVLLHLGQKKMVLIVNGDQDLEEQVVGLITSTGIDRQFHIGCSVLDKNSSSLVSLIHEAEIAAYHYIIYPEFAGGIFRFAKKPLNVVKCFIKNMNIFVSENDINTAISAIDNIPDMLINNDLSMLHVTYLYNEITSVLSHTYDIESVRMSYMDCNQLVNRFPTLEIICEYFKNIILNSSCYCGDVDDASTYLNNNFRKLLKYVDENYSRHLSLKDLSEQYFIGFSYCCFLFKRATNKTFSEYISHKRMGKAYGMLQTGDYSISYVADQVGYSDQYYFCKKFKKYYGFAPSRILAKL